MPHNNRYHTMKMPREVQLLGIYYVLMIGKSRDLEASIISHPYHLYLLQNSIWSSQPIIPGSKARIIKALLMYIQTLFPPSTMRLLFHSDLATQFCLMDCMAGKLMAMLNGTGLLTILVSCQR